MIQPTNYKYLKRYLLAYAISRSTEPHLEWHTDLLPLVPRHRNSVWSTLMWVVVFMAIMALGFYTLDAGIVLKTTGSLDTF